jgi:hypothetical protein
VAAPKILKPAWAGKTSIEQIGTTEQVRRLSLAGCSPYGMGCASPELTEALHRACSSHGRRVGSMQVLDALSPAKLRDVLVGSEVYTGRDGRVYYTYELQFKSPPAVHRLLTLTVVDGTCSTSLGVLVELSGQQECEPVSELGSRTQLACELGRSHRSSCTGQTHLNP